MLKDISGGKAGVGLKNRGKKADFCMGYVQRDIRSYMICLLSFDPRVDFLSLSFSLPVPLFHSQETEGFIHTRPLTTGSSFFPSFVGQ